MNLVGNLRSCSVFGFAALTFLMASLSAQAETPTNTIISQKESTLQSERNLSSEVAQRNRKVDPGRATRSGSSYFGLGVNLGLDGGKSLGDDSLTIISKIGLTNSVSFRPAVLIDDEATFLLPLTFDFWTRNVSDGGLRIAPYLGGGLSIATGDGDTVGLLLSGGLDIPLSPNFTANTAINVNFIDNTGTGLLLGVGYNF